MNARLEAEGYPEQEHLYAIDDYCESDARCVFESFLDESKYDSA